MSAPASSSSKCLEGSSFAGDHMAGEGPVIHDVGAESDEEVGCAICMQGKDEDDVTTACGHSFCVRCITRWKNQCESMSKEASCPLCRRLLRPAAAAVAAAPAARQPSVFNEQEHAAALAGAIEGVRAEREEMKRRRSPFGPAILRLAQRVLPDGIRMQSRAIESLNDIIKQMLAKVRSQAGAAGGLKRWLNCHARQQHHLGDRMVLFNIYSIRSELHEDIGLPPPEKKGLQALAYLLQGWCEMLLQVAVAYMNLLNRRTMGQQHVAYALEEHGGIEGICRF